MKSLLPASFLFLLCGTSCSTFSWREKDETVRAAQQVSQEVAEVVEAVPTVIGTLSWVDSDSPQAVIILRQSNQSPPSFFFSRNPNNGQVTGILESQDLQQGKSLATTILKGSPRAGDLVTPLGMDVKTAIRTHFR